MKKKEKQFESTKGACSMTDSCEKEKCTHKKEHNLGTCTRIYFCREINQPVRCKGIK